jgi:hypothetical protein
MAMPPNLSPAVHDLIDELHDRKLTALQAGVTPGEVLSVEIDNLAGTIVAYADDDVGQQAVLTFVLETLPDLVAQRQQAERWRLTFGEEPEP